MAFVRRDRDEIERISALRNTGLLEGEPNARIDGFVAHVATVLGRDAAFLALVDGEREIVRYGPATLRGAWPRAHGVAAAAIEVASGRIAFDDAGALDKCPVMNGRSGLRSVAAVVVTGSRGQRLGALCAGDDRQRTIGAHELEQLAALAAEIGLLIESVRIEREATRDMVADLCEAASAASLPLAFQPIVRARDLAVVGCESLLRWNRRDGTPMPPDMLLPMVERLGLVRPVDTGVLRSALAIAADWPPAIRLAVNVSGHWFDLPGRSLVDTVAALLRATGFPPDRLTVEVTERVLIRDKTRAVEDLAGLRALGVEIALDDFGSGWSSLSYLAALPLDIVKLDRSFIRRLPGDARNDALIRGVVEICHTLGMRVCVEGIEEADQLHHVRDLGCDLLQGFLLGAPTADPAPFFDRAMLQPA